jgi:HEAT repeat protein
LNCYAENRLVNAGVLPALILAGVALAQAHLYAAPPLAMDELERRFGGPQAIEQVVRLLESDDPTVRRLAAQAITEFGPSSGMNAQTILGFVRDEDAVVRGHIVRATGEIGTQKSTLAEVERCLSDPAWFVRSAAATALGVAGQSAEKSCPRLVKVLIEDDSTNVAHAAANALGEIGLTQQDDIEGVVKVVVDPSLDSRVRIASARALWTCSMPEAARSRLRAALPDVVDDRTSALKADTDSARESLMVQLATIVAVARSDFDPRYARFLMAAGKANLSYEPIVEEVADGLGCLGEKGRDGVPFLLDVINQWQKDKFVLYNASQSAIRALGRVAPNDPRVIQALRGAITADFDQHAEAAISSLKMSKDSEATDILRQSMNMPSPRVRLLAAQAYFSRTSDAERVLPVAIGILQTPEENVLAPTITGFSRRRAMARLRRNAVSLLGDIGPPAREALPLITPLADDAFRDLGQSVEQALIKIRRD